MSSIEYTLRLLNKGKVVELQGRDEAQALPQQLGKQRVLWTLRTTTDATCNLLFSEGVEIGRVPGCLLMQTFVRYGEGVEVEAGGEETKECDGFEAQPQREGPTRNANTRSVTFGRSVQFICRGSLSWTVSTYAETNGSRVKLHWP